MSYESDTTNIRDATSNQLNYIQQLLVQLKVHFRKRSEQSLPPPLHRGCLSYSGENSFRLYNVALSWLLSGPICNHCRSLLSERISNAFHDTTVGIVNSALTVETTVHKYETIQN
eukprot:9363-Amphidinium_carterae.1